LQTPEYHPNAPPAHVPPVTLESCSFATGLVRHRCSANGREQSSYRLHGLPTHSSICAFTTSTSMLIADWCVQSNPVASSACATAVRATMRPNSSSVLLPPPSRVLRFWRLLVRVSSSKKFAAGGKEKTGEDREGGESRQGPQLLLPPL
jgi:hypothetical protein